ncbi:MAG TPA: DUF2058 domain-containing protein [Thiotrichales bacterium]|nr:DUF2058 domain-containing protein [Thiotrichales bacterium]
MNNPFQEQLLKLGLVDEKQVKKARQASRKKKGRKGRGHAAAPEEAEAARRRQEEKRQRDREANLRRQEERKRKELRAQVKQIVRQGCLRNWEGELPYRFVVDGKIRTIHLGEEARRQVVGGRAAIVRNGDRHVPVSAATAEKLLERDASVVVCWHREGASSDGSDDDGYPPVPDDLVW